MNCMDDFDDLSNYKVLRVLNNRNSVFLVKNTLDGNYYIKKYIEIENIPVYQIMLGVKHRNLVSPEKMFTSDSKTVVIEEYIEGTCLDELLDNNIIFNFYDARKIIVQICEGLKRLHKLNIIHRDISPGNIIIKDDGTIKIIDFGISRIKKENKSSDTSILGTSGFAAPEQFGFRQTDERADIFSIGVLMNFMLTGELPGTKIYDKSEGVRRIILKCIEIDPSNRFKDIKALKTALYKFPAYDYSFLRIPGFRTKKTWKKIIAVIVYYIWLCGTFVSLILLIAFLDNTENTNNLSGSVGMFSFITGFILVPFLLMSNYVYFTERVPIIKSLPKCLKGLVRFILAVLVMIIVVNLILLRI